MENLGYYNGKFGPLDQMTIPMNDRVCWFGDGVYDAGPARNHRIFALDEHIARFYRSAAAANIQIPVAPEELASLLQKLLDMVDGPEHFVYYQCTRGTAIRNHAYDDGMEGNLWVMIKPQVMPDGTQRIQLRTEPDTRFFHCNIKSLNLLPNVLSSQAAKREGVFETVYFRDGAHGGWDSGGGRVTECSHCNVSIIKDGVFRTAPCNELILPGIARAHLIKACHALDIPVMEEPFNLEDLFQADEVIVSSSSNLCLFADMIDGKPVGDGSPQLSEAIRSWVFQEFADASLQN